MTKNIKEIGKELMGKSLNSFHRKTSLTQLEENNKMQDGILNGILSQVDDAYIEKTEQSNVMHLDGSGDGVVVLDSIEGNTKVNILQKMKTLFSRVNETNIGDNFLKLNYGLKPNTKYTRMIYVPKIVLGSFSDLHMCDSITGADGVYKQYTYRVSKTGWIINEFTTTSSGTEPTYVINPAMSHFYEGSGTEIQISDIVILEGGIEDNKCINDYFEGLQSSFEEKVNSEGKYEIEILMKNRNLLGNNNKDLENWIDGTYLSKKIQLKPNTTYSTFSVLKKAPTSHCVLNISRVPYTGDNNTNSPLLYTEIFNTRAEGVGISRNRSFTTDASGICYLQYYENGHRKYLNNIDLSQWFDEICDVTITEGYNILSNHIEPKQNKIKLLINEPLRGLTNTKDVLCVKNNKLVVERNCGKYIMNGSESWNMRSDTQVLSDVIQTFSVLNPFKYGNRKTDMLNDKFPQLIGVNGISGGVLNGYGDSEVIWLNHQSAGQDCLVYINISKTKLPSVNTNSFKQWLSNNPIEVIYELAEPYYEEVTNEYGEPIILEGYENGTLYIDSTIVPTTTARYTPKIESFKAIKEVKDNNIMLTSDINDAIIPYMLEVDMMILEKEMAIMSRKNMRKLGEKDMTNMQKRTYDMLARLIKGKTLNEQECKTRVTVYLNADKITDEQAKELNFLIDEIYA